MLPEELISKFNHQINLKFYSCNLYLQMGAWCQYRGFEGATQFLNDHAADELAHMRRLLDYMNNAGSMVSIGRVDSPPTEFESLHSVFQHTYNHQCDMSNAIDDLADTAFQEKDYSTFNFLKWYVAEQHKNEKLTRSILDKLDIFGEKASNLPLIDKLIGQLRCSREEPTVNFQPLKQPI